MNDPFGVVGIVLAGKFRVERLVGEGGFGLVYAGTHLVLGEPIAIKFIRTEADSWLREARILFSLAHPAIVRMYDVGALEHRGGRLPWVVLELVNGPTLDREISERRRAFRPFGLHELQQIFDPILDGLAFAHARGVLHRDMKPSNIALPRTSTGAIEPKLLDFGTARTQVSALESALGKTGFTPLYGAPEQWDPQIAPPTPATDVYSFALTMLEAATFVEPHAGAQDIPSIVRHVMTGTGRPRLDMARPDLPPSFGYAIERALSVRPEHRYRDANEFRNALRAPITAPAVTAPTPPKPRSYTYTILGIAAGSSALALVSASIIFVTCNYPRPTPTPTATVERPKLGKPVVVDASDFDLANAVDVVRKNHVHLESCASSNAPFEGEVDLVLEVKTTDGHVANVSCNPRTSGNDGIPDVSAFCSCAQAETAKWVFQKPHSDLGELAALAEETQSLRVRYTSKR